MEITKAAYAEIEKTIPFTLVQQWNPDGVTKNIHKYGMKATHYPKIGFVSQKVVIIKDDIQYTRRLQNGKWSEIMVKEL